MTTRTALIVIAAILLLVAPFARSAAPAGAAAKLPSSFGEWNAGGAATQSSPGNLDKIAGGQSSVLREYGLVSAAQSSYSHDSDTATVTLYAMSDSSAAFGAFTFLRDSKMTGFAAGDAAYAAASGDRALLVVGNLLLDVDSPGKRPANQDLIALATAVNAQASHAPYPTIGGFLPEGGMIPASLHYVLGPQAFAQAFPLGAADQRDWIGFDKSAEVAVARYRLEGASASKGDEALLLVALYPTQQVAAEKYDNFGGWMALNAGPTEQPGRPHLFGKRSGALVALVAGASSQREADTLLDNIQYSSQVTWNEPTHQLTDPSIGTMVVGAIMGTGAIMALAVAAGIGFGGVRLFVKFLFPGKVFDRSDQVEILQLGLSGKRIDAEDFYELGSSRDS